MLAAQRQFRLPETGVVDPNTWDEIYDQYSGIENTTLRSGETFPQSQPAAVAAGSFGRSRQSTTNSYNRTTTLTQFPGRDLAMGNQDPVRQEVVR